jgi:hypothetical protein
MTTVTNSSAMMRNRRREAGAVAGGAVRGENPVCCMVSPARPLSTLSARAAGGRPARVGGREFPPSLAGRPARAGTGPYRDPVEHLVERPVGRRMGVD